jgi:hypothetical protein
MSTMTRGHCADIWPQAAASSIAAGECSAVADRRGSIQDWLHEAVYNKLIDRTRRQTGLIREFDRLVMAITGIPGNSCDQGVLEKGRSQHYRCRPRQKQDTFVKGVIIYAAQIAIDFSRFTHSFTFRTQEQIEEWLLDLQYWLGEAEEYAVANYWPLKDTASDKYGGCKFRKVCSRSPQAREATETRTELNCSTQTLDDFVTERLNR